MKTTGKTPLEVERKLLAFIFPDFILTLFIFGFLFSIAVVYSKIFDLVSSMVVIAMLLFIAALMGVVRFFRFFSTTSRMMAAFQNVYEGFGGGKSQVSVSCPQPLVIVNIAKDLEFGDADAWKLSMTSQSDTYTFQAEATVDDKAFSFSLDVTDWRGMKHQANTEGRVSLVKDSVNKIITALKDEVSKNHSSNPKLVPEPNFKQALDQLKKLDKVAYIRFASICRDFENLKAFEAELKKLKK